MRILNAIKVPVALNCVFILKQFMVDDIKFCL